MVKTSLEWNQWLIGVMWDRGRIIPQKWFVVILGPLTISFPYGRRTW